MEVNSINANEIKEVHKKGTKVVGLLDFDAIEARWKAILDEEANTPAPEESTEGEDDADEGTVVDPAIRFIEYCKAETTKQLEVCDALELDGVEVNFTGTDLNIIVGEEATAAETARQGAFFDLISNKIHTTGKTLLFKGLPQNVINKEILSDCKYIIINAHSSKSFDEMSYLVLMASTNAVPVDRFVMGVSTPYITAAGTTNGKMKDGSSSITGAAYWAVSPTVDYTKAGISIDAAQQDYFNAARIYPVIREAINIMNPTVK